MNDMSIIEIQAHLLEKIQTHGENKYPYEGAGLLLGTAAGNTKRVSTIKPLHNSREDSARHNRYLITPQDMLLAEREAMRLGLDVIGVFHSHPDHPNRPSEFDRDWALPWYSYLITSIKDGKEAGSRSWRLAEDRSTFHEEKLVLVSSAERI